MNIRGILLAFLLLIAGCSEVAITGRSQFNFVPESMINSMALNSYQSFLEEAELSDDSAKTAMVTKVGNDITNAVDKYGIRMGIDTSSFKWEIKLVEDDTVNAWCMPGGKIVVYTGILKYADTDDKLAVVIGHEVAHAVAKHGSERMSQQLAITGVSLAASEAMKEESEKKKQIFQTAFAVGAQFGFLLPYSRAHEYEADEIGLLFSTLAGYNPDAGVELWKAMAEANGDDSMDFFSTHPATEKRIERLERLAPITRTKAANLKNAGN